MLDLCRGQATKNSVFCFNLFPADSDFSLKSCSLARDESVV